MKSPNRAPRYSRHVPYGLAGGLRSAPFERRSKRSFRRWLRRRVREHVERGRGDG